MSTWTDRIRGHEVWKELDGLGPAIDRAESRWTTDAQAKEGLQRLRAVLGFCGKRLAATDPDLLEPRPLATLARALTAARAELEAFVTDQNAAHVVAANAQGDEVLAALPAILAPAVPDDLTAISEAAASYRTALERYLREAAAIQVETSTAAEANKAKLTELAAGLAAEKQRLSTLVTDYQSQFSSAQDSRATEFAAAQTDRQTKYAVAISDMQTSFSSAQDTRANEFTAAQTDRQQKLTSSASEQQALFSTAQETRTKEFADAQSERSLAFTTLIAEQTKKLTDTSAELTSLRDTAAKDFTDALAQLRSGYEASATKILSGIEAHKAQVEKLVGVIGNLGVTSGYQKIANRAQTMIYLWQFLTVAALAGLIFVAYIIAFAPPVAEALFLQGLSTRVFLSVTVGVFAGYAARQAKINFDIEKRNRKLALELEALGPFIAPLPEEMQFAFRKDLGERSFGIPEPESSKSETPDPVSALDLLKELRDLIGEVSKSKG
jgi:hypothetical protein